MPSERYLIVNADDFGQTPGVNHGIIEAHERGIVTSTSLMVRWPAAPDAAAYGRSHPEFSIGLHLDLAEWIYRDGAWAPLYVVVPANDRAAVAAEVERQLKAFHELMARPPSHIDSHQHIHREDPVRSVVLEEAGKLAVPVRHFSSQVTYSGDFYGQTAKGYPYPEGIDVGNLLRIVKTLPAGVTELGCHPGIGNDVDSMYCAERVVEVQSLCDSRVRAALDTEGVRLCSFHTMPPGQPN
jgi:predicted glycoside hydrolase/deacetylase ChbG (UPF0249 family)